MGSDKIVAHYKQERHFEKGKLIPARELRIYYDEYAENPRTEYDNLGTMLCVHRRYDLGDKHTADFDEHIDSSHSWNEIEEWLKNELNAVHVLPLYLYDHSGIAISVTPFYDCWDSGRLGVIYVTLDDLKQNFMTDEITDEMKQIAYNILAEEVRVYDQYLQGEVYCYNEVDENGDVVDSCCGFYNIADILEFTRFTEMYKK